MISAVCSPHVMSGFRSGISTLPKATEKVVGWISKHFGLLENGFFLSYGAKELIFDGILAKRKVKPLDPDATFSEKAIHKIKSLMANVFQVHGELYVGSALAGTAVELHHLQFINLGPVAPVVGLIGNGLFLYASLLSLAFHVDLYQKAEDLGENGGKESLVKALKASAIMGIINSIGYVIAAIATIAAGGVTIAIVFGCFALAVGCVKVLYDYFVLSKELSPKAL